MPRLRRAARLTAAALAVVTLLGVAPGRAFSLEPPRPLPDHRPAFVTETDVRPWTDCLWASAAMLLDKWTNGDVRVSHQRLRRLSGDLAGGSSFSDMRVAFRRLGFDVPLDANGDSTMTWRGLLSRLRSGGGAVVLGDYGELPAWYGRWDYGFWKGRSKTDNHAMYVERYDPRRGRVWLMDPLGRGEWQGEWLSVSALYRYAWFQGGRVQAIATPAARPAPFAGVRVEDGRLGVSSKALSATWGLGAPRGWRFSGADVQVDAATAADPLDAAARSAAVPVSLTHDPAPPEPVATVHGSELRAAAALPTEPGAYSLSLAVTDRRFGRLVASAPELAVFVPGERRGTIQLHAWHRAPEAGSAVRVAVMVTNDGERSWADAGIADAEGRGAAPRATRLVAAWIRLEPSGTPAGPAAGAEAGTDDFAPGTDDAVPGTDGEEPARERLVVELGRVPLAPGESVRVWAEVAAPPVPGRWALVLDVVDDVDGSFAALGSEPAVALFEVEAAASAHGTDLVLD